jgi:hypothetical protein
MQVISEHNPGCLIQTSVSVLISMCVLVARLHKLPKYLETTSKFYVPELYRQYCILGAHK